MNVPVETRIDQIRLNLERWRWLPRDLGVAPHPREHPASTQLEVWDNDRSALAMRVVVGKQRHADADLQRRDDAHRLQPVLERPAGHRARTKRFPAIIRTPPS